MMLNSLIGETLLLPLFGKLASLTRKQIYINRSILDTRNLWTTKATGLC